MDVKLSDLFSQINKINLDEKREGQPGADKIGFIIAEHLLKEVAGGDKKTDSLYLRFEKSF